MNAPPRRRHGGHQDTRLHVASRALERGREHLRGQWERVRQQGLRGDIQGGGELQEVAHEQVTVREFPEREAPGAYPREFSQGADRQPLTFAGFTDALADAGDTTARSFLARMGGHLAIGPAIRSVITGPRREDDHGRHGTWQDGWRYRANR